MNSWCNAAAVLVSLVPMTTAFEEPGGTEYDVSAIAANGFPTADDKYDELLGSHLEGSLADLTSSDDEFFDVDSEFLPGQGYYASLRADFVITEPASTVTELGITIETHRSPDRLATGSLFAYDWTADKYQYIMWFSIKSAGNDKKLVKIEKNAVDYVSATGRVRVVVRAHRSRGRKLKPYRLRTDLVRLNVRTSRPHNSLPGRTLSGEVGGRGPTLTVLSAKTLRQSLSSVALLRTTEASKLNTPMIFDIGTLQR